MIRTILYFLLSILLYGTLICLSFAVGSFETVFTGIVALVIYLIKIVGVYYIFSKVVLRAISLAEPLRKPFFIMTLIIYVITGICAQFVQMLCYGPCTCHIYYLVYIIYFLSIFTYIVTVSNFLQKENSNKQIKIVSWVISLIVLVVLYKPCTLLVMSMSTTGNENGYSPQTILGASLFYTFPILLYQSLILIYCFIYNKCTIADNAASSSI